MGFLRVFQDFGLTTDLLPLLVFLGLGALTDFEPMLSNPKTLLLGAGAQAGVFFALIGALLLGMTTLFDFGLFEASSIGIIGGADGPTTIFIATRMKELGEAALGPGGVRDVVGATAVAAYSYMALVPIIQPPIIRLLTTKAERQIKMPYSYKPVSKRMKILFPIITAIVVSVLVPKASPLIAIMMFGNLLKESGVVDRLSNTAQNELMNIVIILLGLAVGATMPAAVFLKPETIAIFFLGLFAFITATATGIRAGQTHEPGLQRPRKPDDRRGRGFGRSDGGARGPGHGAKRGQVKLSPDARHGTQRGRRHRHRDGCGRLAGGGARPRQLADNRAGTYAVLLVVL